MRAPFSERSCEFYRVKIVLQQPGKPALDREFSSADKAPTFRPLKVSFWYDFEDWESIPTPIQTKVLQSIELPPPTGFLLTVKEEIFP